MSFSILNDINILSAADTAIVSAGAGNDRYILAPGFPFSADQTLTISDTEGINTLQLMGGLTIISSRFAVDSLQLTLSNGATLNLLGASKFVFEVGGNHLLGILGTVQSFAQFATISLGAGMAPTGTSVVNGASNVGINTNGTTTLGGAPPPVVPVNSVINGTPGNDTLSGTSNADTLNGLAGDDNLFGYGGDDVLNGGMGNDTIDGGTGTGDVALYQGNFADYSFGYDTQALRFTITDRTAGRDGTDKVTNVELFQFKDGIRTADVVKAAVATAPGMGLLSLAQSRGVVDADVTTLANKATLHVNALTAGPVWNKSVVTFSFNTSIPTDYMGDASLTRAWSPLTAVEQSAVRQIVLGINKFLGLQIVEVANGGDMRINAVQTNTGVAGFAYYPGPGVGGDVFLGINQRTIGNFQPGAEGWLVFLHEIGHALGLKHSFEAPIALPSALDDSSHSVMSYTSVQDIKAVFKSTPNSISVEYEQSGLPSAFSLYDVQALHALYGANTTTTTGNTTYTINTAAMEHLTIWDGGGIDKLDFSTATAPCIVDMRPSTFSSVNLKTPQMLIDEGIALLQAQGKSGAWVDNYVRQVITEPTSGARFYTGKDNVAIVAGTVIEDLLTGSGNDQVRDNFVNNIIFTGAGNDTIFLGAGGFDYVNGGLGTDTAVFTVAQSSVQKEKQVDGSWLVVAATYAAQLVGVERFEFTDGTFFV